MSQVGAVIIGVDAVIGTAIEVVGRGDVQLPEVVGLPRRHRLRIDGLDVSKGHQAEHFESLRRAHFFRKCLYIGRIEDIPADCGRHFEVISDEETESLAVGGIEVKAACATIGMLQAHGNVTFVGRGLA